MAAADMRKVKSKNSKRKSLDDDDEDYVAEDSSSSSSDTDSDNSDPDWEQPVTRTRRSTRRTQDRAGETGKNGRVKVKDKAGGGKKKHGRLSGKREAVVKVKEDDSPRQCYWIECVKPARKGSKYCSDECGISLAKLRILTILPERISEWNATPCFAEEKDKERLKEVKKKRYKYKEQFDELDELRQDLDEFIETVSKLQHDPTVDPTDAGSGDDGLVTCVICRQEVNGKTYIKHVDACFTKTEKLVVFEAKAPSYLPGVKLYCDIINKENGLYCKRLHVNCPDHSKKMPFDKNAICGAPLSNSITTLNLDLGNVCRRLKSRCMRHYNWEKTYRSDIDIQKVVAWTNLDQMLKEETVLKQQMSQRGGLLNLLLNSTKREDK